MPIKLELDPSLFFKIEGMSPERINRIQNKFGMTQPNFPDLLGVKYNTYCKWEIGVRHPSSPGYALLNIADKHPEIFLANRKEIISNIMKYFKGAMN